MAEFRFTVNGNERTVVTDPDRPLLEVLREDLQITGTKYGCGEGQCRACTVLIGGKPAITCVTPVRTAAGKSIVTIEGIAPTDRLHIVQQAFLDEGAMQCGYCIPGMVLRTIALLQTTPRPTDAQIVDALDGSLCRCCNYPRILEAVRKAASHA
jgi:aerobic-type carbon monoxide dehydrogenase small subunit (CoxS/CutS family)